MAEIVLDASAAIEAIATSTPTSRAILHRLENSVVHAPHLIDAEAGHVLRRHVMAGLMTADQAAMSLYALRDLVDQRYEHTTLSARAWQLRDTVTYYDALYVALATTLSLPLVTADLKLAGAPGLTCVVETIT